MPVRHALQETRSTSRATLGAPADAENDQYYEEAVYEAVEAAQPIPANLIEFPREIMATRRMRPRITEALLEII